MRILDENGIELTNPDLTLGHLEEEEILVAHHEAVEAVEEQGHYEVIAEYPDTNGKDVEWVVDVPGVEAQEAWDTRASSVTFFTQKRSLRKSILMNLHPNPHPYGTSWMQHIRRELTAYDKQRKSSQA